MLVLVGRVVVVMKVEGINVLKGCIAAGSRYTYMYMYMYERYTYVCLYYGH